MLYLKALPSQRQGQKQKLYEVWVALHKKGGWVLTANCTCMAGLGSACSHVGALLFKLQASALLGINKIACTSKLCAWKRSRRFAEPALMTEIDFSRPKQKQTVPKEKKVVSDRKKKPFSFRDPTHLNNEFHKQKLKELYTVNPDAAILTSLYNNDPEDFTVTKSLN
ncbi:uncharacterized protein LOC130612565 [Hydractinia symbiolongicarpus]|uniref:uncharacterized protein LOC130612565 n=1 Tax=Hydractinia symbiolongicarpus TaxID=13093 RepID=UPI00254EABE6|nr:uncharacterized protein LOC130612565 [Hydractinia symbiolongicarpus]